LDRNFDLLPKYLSKISIIIQTFIEKFWRNFWRK